MATNGTPEALPWLAQLAPIYRASELPPLLRNLVAALNSPASRRAYLQSLRHYAAWARQEDESVLSREAVLHYREAMTTPDVYGKTTHSTATVNLRLAALRALAREAAESGLISSATAYAITRIKGVTARGQRLGQWLPSPEMHALVALPDTTMLRGLRDRAILMILFGAGLRRAELTGLSVNHIQQRQGRWGLVDLLGKGGRTRSVPLPAPAKLALDEWLAPAGIRQGPVFRAITRHGKLSSNPLTGEAILQILHRYGQTAGVERLRPHDARRTFAQLCRTLPDSRLEDIQELLGHQSLDTTRRYLAHGEGFSRAANAGIFGTSHGQTGYSG